MRALTQMDCRFMLNCQCKKEKNEQQMLTEIQS